MCLFFILNLQLCSVEEKTTYVKASLKATVEDENHAGRLVKTSCRCQPMHDLKEPWLQELKQEVTQHTAHSQRQTLSQHYNNCVLLLQTFSEVQE